MIYFEAPTYLDFEALNQDPKKNFDGLSRGRRQSVFLGGGISSCPDWQSQVVKWFEPYDVVVFNPRRRDFDVSNPKMSEEQIEVEFDALQICRTKIFWFSEGSLNPITLFEYGKELGKSSKNLFIGCHPSYLRKFDVEFQTKLDQPDLKVHSSLEDLFQDLVTTLALPKI